MVNLEQDNLEVTQGGAEQVDPLMAILSDPESHLSDVLYLYFRIYKRRLLWRFMQTALQSINLLDSNSDMGGMTALPVLLFTDIGASMGFDELYLINMLTDNFRKPLPFEAMVCSFVEGDKRLIARGEISLKNELKSSKVQF